MIASSPSLSLQFVRMSKATSPSAAPREVVALVENFAEHRETYRRGDYKEASLLIQHTDAEIDRLVYELYGLTDEEIALVEAATK